MSQIIVSANELTNKKEALSALKKTFKTQIEQLESEARKLDTMWDGEAKQKYKLAMTIDIDKLKLFLKVIEEFIEVLATIISMYRLMEMKNANLASS